MFLRKLIFYIKSYPRDSRLSPELTALVYKCVQLIETCHTTKVEIDYYNLVISTANSKIIFWNANKYYAWLCSGSINGRHFSGIQPSVEAAFALKECLRKHGYNIHAPEERQKIYILDVKC